MIISHPTTKRDRIAYIVGMYSKILGKPIDSQTTIKNATIEKLCESNGGPYQRIKGWCEDKLKELEEKELVENYEDMIKARELFHKCFDLMKSRNEKYGDSWKVLTIPSLANLCEMKLHRIANLPEGAPKTEDELMDTINYCIFGLMKLEKTNEKEN